MKNEKYKNISVDLVVDDHSYMDNLRHNLGLYISYPGITLKELAEDADISFDTLKTLIYGSAKDCKLSTVLALARALRITVDELIGNPGKSTDMIRIYRKLPGNSKHLIDWHIRHQKFINEKHSTERSVSIMEPICMHNGNLKLTNDYIQVDISKINPDNLHKVFFGIRIPCEHYLPHYMQGDILLIANDRNPLACENTVIIVNGNICIVKQRIENSQTNYYSIRDGGFRSSSHDSIEILGYIAEVMEYTPTR